MKLTFKQTLYVILIILFLSNALVHIIQASQGKNPSWCISINSDDCKNP